MIDDLLTLIAATQPLEAFMVAPDFGTGLGAFLMLLLYMVLMLPVVYWARAAAELRDEITFDLSELGLSIDLEAFDLNAIAEFGFDIDELDDMAIFLTLIFMLYIENWDEIIGAYLEPEEPELPPVPTTTAPTTTTTTTTKPTTTTTKTTTSTTTANPNRPQAEINYNMVVANLNPIRYRGYYQDAETGFYFLQTRYYNPQWRRFINADVYFIAGKDALNAVNMYAYCNGNPVMNEDPEGMLVGTRYKTMDAAAIAWGKQYNKSSINDRVEYGSVIYSIEVNVVKLVPYETVDQYGKPKLSYKPVIVKETRYSYNKPNKGNEWTVAPNYSIPSGASVVAIIHSHGPYRSGDTDNDSFSAGDISAADEYLNFKRIWYVACPSGNMYKYNPVTKVTEQLPTTLYKDPNYPK